MNTAKNIMLFFAAFIVMGFLVLLIDQMYPTNSDNSDFQTYTSRDDLKLLDK